jgi:hypothetical protein
MATAGNVRVGVTGAVYYAPTTTTLPTSAATTLNAAFADVGYISEDGITQTMNVDVTDIQAWQNGDVVRKIQTSHDLTYSFTMMEMSAETVELFYGDYTAGVTEITGTQLGNNAFVLDVIDGDHDIRIVIPDGQVTERGDIVYSGTEPIGFEVTITCFPDADGVKAYHYADDFIS